MTGITAIAYHKEKGRIGVFVHPNGSGDMPLIKFRNKLLEAKFSSAVFLDGSTSSMLMVDGKFYARQTLSKDRTNSVGIGFKYSK